MSSTEVISNWSTLIENFSYSPQKFYARLGKAIQRRQMPDTIVGRVNFKEGNVLSARRKYLTVYYKKELYFVVCGAPFGTGFFVSWWLLLPPDGCLVSSFKPFPVLSLLAKAMARPWTYYRADTASMFQTATHQAVLEVVDTIMSEQNVSALPEAERKPLLREFFQN